VALNLAIEIDRRRASESRVAEMAEKMRKRSIETGASFLKARNDKALNNQGFVV